MSRLGRRLRRVRWAWAGLVFGGLIGVCLAHGTAGHFTTPEPLNEPGWQLVSPMLDATVQEPIAGRGTHVLDGALVITEHVFYRSDTVRLRMPSEVRSIEVEVAPDSGRLGILPGQGPTSRVELEPDLLTLYQPGSHKFSLISPVIRLVQEGSIWRVEFDGKTFELGSLSPNVLEFETAEGRSRLRRLRVEDASGRVVIDKDFSQEGLPSRGWLWGLLLGAVAGCAIGQRVSVAGRSSVAWSVLWLAIPLGVCAVSPAGWLQIVEAAYLAETTAWSLARWCLVASMFPLLLSGVSAIPGVALDSEALRRGKRADRLVWGVLALCAVGWGGKGLGLVGLGLLVLFVVLPLWLVYRERLPLDPWLRRDVPALVAVIGFGWGVGTLIALLWRWTLLMSSLSTLVRYAPRATAEVAFVMLLALPLTGEAAARASYLEQVWTPEGLQVGFVSEQGSDEVALGWTGSCGPATATEVYRVAYAGGSSTGGAYQFGDDSEAFFPAQAHGLLCAERPEGVRLESFNFGDGDRTSFTISRTLDQLVESAQPDVLVLYLGVNDVFTKRHGKTSKEREAERTARSASQNLLGRLGASSRLIVGMGAAIRSSQRERSAYVSDVPVEDAAENLEAIADALGEASVVLMTEQVQSGNRAALQAYDKMQRHTAETVENVHFIDVQAGLGEGRVDAFLADRNHLTREGNRAVGGLLLPELRRLLRWTQPE